MIKMYFYLAIFSLIFGCSSITNSKIEKNDSLISSAYVSPQLFAISWYQNSGEAKALYRQGYVLAIHKLKKAIKFNRQHPKQKPLAVVLDIDETVLDNSPYNAGLLRKNLNYPTGWKEWCESSRAKALPGVKDFLEYATHRNVEIFYISNREENVLEATFKNLQSEGLPVKKENLFFKGKTSSKEERRKLVSSKFQIALLLGDNLNDFAEIFEKQDDHNRKLSVENLSKEFGTQYIVFPNPMYGDWEGAIYNYNWKLPSDEKTKLHMQKLETF